MDTLQLIEQWYKIDASDKALVELPNVSREGLASLFHELNFKIGVEIGVEEGYFSETLARSNPQMKLYSVDPWTVYQKTKNRVTSKDRYEGFYESAAKRLSKYPNCEILREYSMDAVKRFADESIDCVYIDGNHAYEFVTEDITEWGKKVRKGGIIAGHDFRNCANPMTLMAVKPAVLDYVRINKIQPLIIWGTSENLPEEIREKSRTWCWVQTIT